MNIKCLIYWQNGRHQICSASDCDGIYVHLSGHKLSLPFGNTYITEWVFYTDYTGNTSITGLRVTSLSPLRACRIVFQRNGFRVLHFLHSSDISLVLGSDLSPLPWTVYLGCPRECEVAHWVQSHPCTPGWAPLHLLVSSMLPGNMSGQMLSSFIKTELSFYCAVYVL